MPRPVKRKPLPPPHYTNLLQAQLLSGRGKPRVWFATCGDRQWVVKGPVVERERDGALLSQRYKELLHLPHTNLRCESTAEGDFLIQRCLIDYTTLETRTATTGFEANVVVPADSHICPWRDEMLVEYPELTQPMLEALLFRKVVGAHDTCRWNVMVVPEPDYDDEERTVLHLYSIDDEAAPGRTTPRMWKAKACPEAFGMALDRCWDALQSTMDRWEQALISLPSSDPLRGFALQQLQLHRNPAAWRWS